MNVHYLKDFTLSVHMFTSHHTLCMVIDIPVLFAPTEDTCWRCRGGKFKTTTFQVDGFQITMFQCNKSSSVQEISIKLHLETKPVSHPPCQTRQVRAEIRFCISHNQIPGYISLQFILIGQRVYMVFISCLIYFEICR